MEDIGTDHNPYTDQSPITGRKFSDEGIIEAGEQFANYERYLSLTGDRQDRGVHKHRADILWALVQIARQR
jgi:hypothetical protein